MKKTHREMMIMGKMSPYNVITIVLFKPKPVTL